MIVTIDALFSKKDKIGSHIISRGTKHLADVPECSHVAMLVNGRWVHESTMKTGVTIVSYDLWKKINIEVERVFLFETDYQLIANCYRRIKGKKYDWLGITFFALAIIPTFFGLKLPKKNLFEDKNKYFCSEVFGYLTGMYYSMMAPCQILRSMRCQ